MNTTPIDISNVTAAILAGGLGTRLRTVVGDQPKVLANVKGRPFITYLLDQLSAAGIGRVVLLTGFGANAVREAIGERYRGLDVRYAHEETPLGTGGALRNALSHIDTTHVLALNGDSFCEADLADLCARHRRPDAAAVLLRRVADASRYGRVDLDLRDRIVHFAEKEDTARAGWINAGVYLLPRARLAEVPAGAAVSFERETLPAWVAAGFVYGVRGDGAFIDIGTPDAYAAAAHFPFGGVA